MELALDSYPRAVAILSHAILPSHTPKSGKCLAEASEDFRQEEDVKMYLKTQRKGVNAVRRLVHTFVVAMQKH